MASKTIHSLAYKVLIDTENFASGVAASRKEINAAKRTMRDVLTPAEEYEIELGKIDKQLKQGLIDQDIYNRKLNKMEKELRGVDNELHDVNRSLGKNNQLMGKAKGAIGGFLAGISVTATADFITNTLQDRARALQEFERFGLNASESFGTFKVIASESGLEVERLVDLTKDLGVRIGEANLDGEGEIFDTFKNLGLDIDELFSKKPEQQLIAFAEAISKVENETERLALTDILLSDAGTDALNVFSKGEKGFLAAASAAERFGYNVSEVESASIAQANEAMKSFHNEVEDLSNTFMSELSPQIKDTLEGLTSVINVFKPVLVQLGKYSMIASGLPSISQGQELLGLKEAKKIEEENRVRSIEPTIEEKSVNLGVIAGVKNLASGIDDFKDSLATGANFIIGKSGLAADYVAQGIDHIKETVDGIEVSQIKTTFKEQTNFESIQSGSVEAFRLTNAKTVMHQQQILSANQRTATNTAEVKTTLEQYLALMREKDSEPQSILDG